MKGWAKVVLGILAALVLFCLMGVALFVSSGKWDQVKKVTGDTLAMKKSAEGLETLPKEFPFEAPADGLVSEARLEAWLSVRERLKPEAGKFNAWTEAHQGEQGGLKEAQEAIGLLSNMIGTTVGVLRENKMSPKEYRFIGKAMDEAAKESGEKSPGGALADESLSALEGVAKEPSLAEEKRQALLEEIGRLKAKQRQGSIPLSHNAELYRRYEGRIRESELGEFGESLLQSGRGRHGVRVEAEKP